MQMPAALPLSVLENTTEFLPRHIGIDAADEAHMLSVIGEASRRALIDGIVPRSIARSQTMDLPPPATEAAALAEDFREAAYDADLTKTGTVTADLRVPVATK